MHEQQKTSTDDDGFIVKCGTTRVFAMMINNHAHVCDAVVIVIKPCDVTPSVANFFRLGGCGWLDEIYRDELKALCRKRKCLKVLPTPQVTLMQEIVWLD